MSFNIYNLPVTNTVALPFEDLGARGGGNRSELLLPYKYMFFEPRRKICVSIVDLVTVKYVNLYYEVLDSFGQTDPAFADAPSTYAVTCRSHHVLRLV